MSAADIPAPDDPIARSLVDLSDEQRLRDAVTDRRRQRDLHERDEDLATLVGSLLDVAESDAVVALTTLAGHTLTGRIAAVSTDHVVVTAPASPRVLLRLTALAVVRVPDGSRAPAGDRPPPDPTSLLDRLGGWLDEPPSIQVALAANAGVVRGHLRSVGDDVVTIVDDVGSWLTIHADAIEYVATVATPTD